MKFLAPLVCLALAAACTPSEPVQTSPGFGTAIGGAAPVATVSTRGALPVYTADPVAVARTRTDDSTIAAYVRANPHSIFTGATGVPFSVLDVTGTAFRVDGAKGSIGFVSDVERPLSVWVAGSEYEYDTVVQTVSLKIAEMAGCSWSGRTQVKTDQTGIDRFAAFLTC